MMKKTRKKILIASFFAALMLLVPFTVVGEDEYINNLEVEQNNQETLQSYTIYEELPGILKFIYSIAEDYVEELLEKLNNGEMTEEQIANYLANEEETISQGLTDVLSEEILSSDGSTVETTGLEDTTETTTENESISGETTGDESNIGSEEVSEELEYAEIEENIYVYLAGDIFDTNNTDKIKERLGWLNGVINFIEMRDELKKKFKEDMIPNVTWVEIIEETLDWLGFDFDVEQFFNDLAAYLVGVFGSSPEIEYVITTVVQFIYSILNNKVGANMKKIYNFAKKRLKGLIKAWFGKELKISPRRAFRQMMLSILSLGLIFSLYILYMNETQVQEYKSQLEEDLENIINNWKSFFNWWETEPWLEPVHINGTVINYDQLENLVVYCEKNPDTAVIVNTTTGYFEGLDFTTSDEKHPRGPHRCVTTAEDTVTGESQTVGNSGNKIINIIRTACFSGGNLTLKIDFDEENNVVYDNEETVQEQDASIEVTTEEQTQNL